MILYHGTSDKMLKPILRHGLRPRVCTGKSVYVGKLESDPDRIYLTDVYPVVFARNAIERLGGNVLIAAVDVPDDQLEPDTDFPDMSGSRECLELTGCVSVVAESLTIRKAWRLSKRQSTEAIASFEGLGGPTIPTGLMHTALRQRRKELLHHWLMLANRITEQNGDWTDDMGRVIHHTPARAGG